MFTLEPIKILLVDDHQLVRDGLKLRLSTRADWVVCGEAEVAPDAMKLVRELSPAVVIIDLSLKNGNGLELIKQIAALPAPPLSLVCSMHDENLYAQRAIQAGARGFLHKQRSAELIVLAVERVLAGNLFVSDEVLNRVLENAIHNPGVPIKSPVEQLTDRELQIFESIGSGMTVSQIAASIFLSTKTVETYRDRAKRKLNLRTSAELMRYAVKWVTEHTGG